MDEIEEIFSLLSEISYVMLDAAKILMKYLIRKNWRDLLTSHQAGHTFDPDGCPYCRYERDIIEPRDANRERIAFRTQRYQGQIGRDVVDTDHR